MPTERKIASRTASARLAPQWAQDRRHAQVCRRQITFAKTDSGRGEHPDVASAFCYDGEQNHTQKHHDRDTGANPCHLGRRYERQGDTKGQHNRQYWNGKDETGRAGETKARDQRSPQPTGQGREKANGKACGCRHAACAARRSIACDAKAKCGSADRQGIAPRQYGWNCRAGLGDCLGHIIHSTGNTPMILTMARPSQVVLGSVDCTICAPLSAWVTHSSVCVGERRKA
jgi:hypothetical protein